METTIWGYIGFRVYIGVISTIWGYIGFRVYVGVILGWDTVLCVAPPLLLVISTASSASDSSAKVSCKVVLCFINHQALATPNLDDLCHHLRELMLTQSKSLPELRAGRATVEGALVIALLPFKIWVVPKIRVPFWYP